MEHRVVDLVFWLIFLAVVSGQEKISLIGDAPSDYNERANMKDCPTRFYTKPYPLVRTLGAYNGERAFRGEFKHMAAIGWTRPGGKIDYLCGGSLITELFILTAAHCNSDSENKAPDTVRLGDTDFGSTEDDAFAQQIGIRRFTDHPQYRGSRSYFDIALIELMEPARFNEAVCPGCLWREPDLPAERMDAIGFGVTGFGEELSPTLQRVQLDKIDLNNCYERIGPRKSIPNGLQDDQFCAAGQNMDTCGGDSGGPIGVKRLDVGGNTISLIAGIVSFGTPCGDGSTGVYTRVGAYIDWLEQETNRSLSYAVCTQGFKCPGRETKTIPFEFDRNPFLARFGLMWSEDDQSVLECGATLIDYQFLLTSAYCVTSRKGYPKFVAFKSQLSLKEIFEKTAITDVYVSPRYIPGRSENDIALVKVGIFIDTDIFRPACLWDRRVDGEWIKPQFRAFGPAIENFDLLSFNNATITIKTDDPSKATYYSNSVVVSYSQNINLMPGVCWLDYGASALSEDGWDEAAFTYGVMSTLSKSCGSTLFVNDITPHINWIEAIVVGRRDKVHIFSD